MPAKTAATVETETQYKRSSNPTISEYRNNSTTSAPPTHMAARQEAVLQQPPRQDIMRRSSRDEPEEMVIRAHDDPFTLGVKRADKGLYLKEWEAGWEQKGVKESPATGTGTGVGMGSTGKNGGASLMMKKKNQRQKEMDRDLQGIVGFNGQQELAMEEDLEVEDDKKEWIIV